MRFIVSYASEVIFYNLVIWVPWNSTINSVAPIIASAIGYQLTCILAKNIGI